MSFRAFSGRERYGTYMHGAVFVMEQTVPRHTRARTVGRPTRSGCCSS